MINIKFSMIVRTLNENKLKNQEAMHTKFNCMMAIFFFFPFKMYSFVACICRTNMWRPEDNSWELVLPFSMCVPGTKFWSRNLKAKCSCLLSYHAKSRIFNFLYCIWVYIDIYYYIVNTNIYLLKAPDFFLNTAACILFTQYLPGICYKM